MKSMCLFGALALGCVSHTDSRVVVEPNILGVTSIETARSVEPDDRVFELRGFDANDNEVGLVRVKIGTVTGLPGVVADDDHQGSEIVMTVAGHTTRTVTRETELLQLTPAPDPATQTFLEIPAVAAQLHDANIIVAKSHAANEIALSTANCPLDQIMTSPEAYQCCYDSTQTLFTTTAPNAWPQNWPGYNAQTLVGRSRNPHGNGCKASDGVSSCLGSACFYGPIGYAKPSLTTPGNFPNYYWKIYSGTNCQGIFVASSWYPSFADENGTAARGQGCPGGNTGAGYWDY